MKERGFSFQSLERFFYLPPLNNLQATGKPPQQSTALLDLQDLDSGPPR